LKFQACWLPPFRRSFRSTLTRERPRGGRPSALAAGPHTARPQLRKAADKYAALRQSYLISSYGNSSGSSFSKATNVCQMLSADGGQPGKW